MVWNYTDTRAPEFALSMDQRFKPVWEELAAVEALLLKTPEDQNELLTAATERLLAAGGKRLRPAICLLSAAIVGAETERSVPLAAGVEMLHTATLVHDDLIDGAALRRGAPTLNAHRSPATTVLVGDYLFARAANMVAKAENLSIMELFANTLMIILNGEIAQRFSRWKVDRQEYEKRIYAKTAALFILATQAAAELGQADQNSKDALIEFGHAAGMAFQIVDDVLDYSGDERQTGKPVGSDLYQGLFTLPAILYAEAQPGDPHLALLTSGEDRGPEAIQGLIDSVRASAAIEAALHKARSFAARAQRALMRLPHSEHTAALATVCDSLIDRTY